MSRSRTAAEALRGGSPLEAREAIRAGEAGETAPVIMPRFQPRPTPLQAAPRAGFRTPRPMF